MSESNSPSIKHYTNDKEDYQAALMSLFSGEPKNTEKDLQKLFTPDFTLRADDTTMDFPGFVKHIQHLREILPTKSVNLTVTVFLRDGSQLAERHVSTTTLADGSVLPAETFQFAKVAEDGRISNIVETVVRKPQERK
jgi:hypothetical protein